MLKPSRLLISFAVGLLLLAPIRAEGESEGASPSTEAIETPIDPGPADNSPSAPQGIQDAQDSNIRPMKRRPKREGAAEAEAVSDSPDIRLDKAYLVRNNRMRFVVEDVLDNGEFYLFEASGKGVMNISMYTNGTETSPFAYHDLRIDSVDGIVYIPLYSEYFASTKGIVFEVAGGKKTDNRFTFTLRRRDRIVCDFDMRVKVLSVFTSRIVFQTKAPPKQFPRDKQYRYQFIAQTSLEHQRLTGFEKLEMLINYGRNIPTTNEHDMVASGNSGTGLVKTLSKSNNYYCSTDNCEYTVALYTSLIQYVYFFPTAFEVGMPITFDHYLYLLEEVEAGEEVPYSFQVPETDGNWVFSIRPIEGVTEAFINPDVKPKEVVNSKYRTSSPFPENVMVTKFEAEKFNFKMNKFFVTFRGKEAAQPTVFKFEVTRRPPDMRNYVRENVAETGVVATDEIINHYLDLLTEKSETLNFSLHLYSFSGHADFYLKECLKEDIDCKLTQDDIITMKNKGSDLINEKRIFRYSALDIQEGETSKQDTILLNFNCKKGNFEFNNSYQTSESCLFVIAIHCRDATNQFGAFYRFEVRGQDKHAPLDFLGSKTLTINKEETKFFKFDLRSLNRETQNLMGIRVVTLTGKANIYFSRKNQFPSESDNELQLIINDVAFSSLHAIETNGAMSLFEDGSNPESLYMTVAASTYTIMDIFAYLFNRNNQELEIQEPAQFNKVMHRKMNADDIVDYQGRKFHMQNFIIDVPNMNEFEQPMVIHVNSDTVGFVICLQESVIMFDRSRDCDYSSDNESLTINERTLLINKAKKFALSVQREVIGAKPDRQVIDFSIMISLQELGNDFKLDVPGKSYTYTTNSKTSTTLTIDLNQMRKTALISIFSDDPQLYAQVHGGMIASDKYIETLDKFKFAMKITDASAFKRKFCGQACNLILDVLSTSENAGRFTVTYTVDQVPIALKDGGMIVLPSSQEIYLVHEPSDNKFPVSFTASCDSTSIVTYAAISELGKTNQKKVSKLLNENNFQFKTNIDVFNQVLIPRELLVFNKQLVINYFMVPKFDIDTPLSKDGIYEFFHTNDKTRVDVHSKIAKLEPYKHVSGEIEKGDFYFYHFTLDRPSDFTVMLSVLSGEADLYLNQGLFNLTTTKMYWKKAVNHRSDEIVVSKSEYSSLDGSISFNIGVFGRDKAKYSVMVVPEFKNLITVTFQSLIEMDLNYNEFYYFDFFNRQEKYNTLLFSENSDIEVSALNFDEKTMETDFIYMIEDESNYAQKFVFHKGDLPRKNMVDHAVDLKTHVIVRMKPIQENAHVNFLIYDSSKPIHTFAERRFTFVQEKGDDHVFQMNLGGDFENVDVDLRLSFGSVEIWISDIADSFNNSTKIDSPGQQYFNFFIDKKKRSNDIIIFDKIYVRVKSYEFSKFSIYSKPKNRFKEIREYESELIFPSPDRDQYVFHFISDKVAKNLHAFSFFIEFVNFYGDKPELYYIPNSDVTLDDKSKLLAMPIVDYIEREKGDFKQIEIKPELRAGYFIIKIVMNNSIKVPIKISLSINNHRNIEINGLYKGSVPIGSSTHSYSMYVPSAGEVRIITESCANIAPNHALYSNRHNSTTISFEDRYNQAFNYVYLDDTTNPKNRMYKVLALPIRRAVVDKPGVFKFEVGKNSDFDREETGNTTSTHYYLMTEFRPKEKELFFKDYINLWEEDEKVNQKKFTYQFLENNKQLKITAVVPRFKQQLLMDYPSLKKINIRFYFDVFYDENFERKLETCGFAVLREIQTERKVVEKTVDAKSIAEKGEDSLVEVLFNQAELIPFFDYSKIQMFCTLSITFFDNENEQYHITLNLKFASVPYFYMVLNNKTKPLTTFSNILFISAFIVVILVLLCVFFYITAKGAEEQRTEKKIGYAVAGEGGSKLEMSSSSMNN